MNIERFSALETLLLSFLLSTFVCCTVDKSSINHSSGRALHSDLGMSVNQSRCFAGHKPCHWPGKRKITTAEGENNPDMGTLP